MWYHAPRGSKSCSWGSVGRRMRENLTAIFCVFALFALIVGKTAVPPDLLTAFSAYQSALDRGDLQRAARYGELTLAAAQKSELLDDAGRARLATMVASAQVRAGNPERARTLYERALAGLGDGAHAGDIATARAALKALERVTADRSLRSTVAAAPGKGG